MIPNKVKLLPYSPPNPDSIMENSNYVDHILLSIVPFPPRLNSLFM